METMLTTIAAWLSLNFMLPPIHEQPRVAFVPAEAMPALRKSKGGSAAELEAFYDDATRTIHLPQGWTGGSPGELSILVHEMVHHMQNLAGLRYACAEEREKIAYAAQRQWLAIFGRQLMEEFKLDPMTLLVRTNCMG